MGRIRFEFSWLANKWAR